MSLVLCGQWLKHSYVERMLSMAVHDFGTLKGWCLCKARWLCVPPYCHVICLFYIIATFSLRVRLLNRQAEASGRHSATCRVLTGLLPAVPLRYITSAYKIGIAATL